MEAKLLLAVIEDLRKKLNILFQQIGNFSDKRVVELSQELDQHIAEYQLLMIKNAEGNSCTMGKQHNATKVVAKWKHDREHSDLYRAI